MPPTSVLPVIALPHHSFFLLVCLFAHAPRCVGELVLGRACDHIDLPYRETARHPQPKSRPHARSAEDQLW